MSNVIEFKRPEPPVTAPEPTLTITIYDNPTDSGFKWSCNSPQPVDRAQVQSYLGDMFLSLADAEPEAPSILQRLETFIRNLFNRSRP